MAFISPPTHIPWYMRIGMSVIRRITKKDLLLPKLLAWYPKAAVSSGVLEAMIAHKEERLDERLLKLVRLAVSFTAGCAFCVDMNAQDWEQHITPEEMAALQGRNDLERVVTFQPYERLAVQYARLATATPVHFPVDFIAALTQAFSEREIVILAVTAAQVNYWTRLIQALGCPPAGYSEMNLLYVPVNVRGKGK